MRWWKVENANIFPSQTRSRHIPNDRYIIMFEKFMPLCAKGVKSGSQIFLLICFFLFFRYFVSKKTNKLCTNGIECKSITISLIFYDLSCCCYCIPKKKNYKFACDKWMPWAVLWSDSNNIAILMCLHNVHCALVSLTRQNTVFWYMIILVWRERWHQILFTLQFFFLSRFFCSAYDGNNRSLPVLNGAKQR